MSDPHGLSVIAVTGVSANHHAAGVGNVPVKAPGNRRPRSTSLIALKKGSCERKGLSRCNASVAGRRLLNARAVSTPSLFAVTAQPRAASHRQPCRTISCRSQRAAAMTTATSAAYVPTAIVTAQQSSLDTASGRRSTLMAGRSSDRTGGIERIGQRGGKPAAHKNAKLRRFRREVENECRAESAVDSRATRMPSRTADIASHDARRGRVIGKSASERAGSGWRRRHPGLRRDLRGDRELESNEALRGRAKVSQARAQTGCHPAYATKSKIRGGASGFGTSSQVQLIENVEQSGVLNSPKQSNDRVEREKHKGDRRE